MCLTLGAGVAYWNGDDGRWTIDDGKSNAECGVQKRQKTMRIFRCFWMANPGMPTGPSG